MASKHFMEGYYHSVMSQATTGPLKPVRFVGGRYESIEAFALSHATFPYQLEGDTVRIDNVLPAVRWHYRNFDGVALLLSDKALAILQKNGSSLADHRDDLAFWQEVYVRDDPLRFTTWLRTVREHPRFAAALPKSVRSAAEISWRDYQRLRWQEYLAEHPQLRNRLPKKLRDF
jgi:hypothetical protein